MFGIKSLISIIKNKRSQIFSITRYLWALTILFSLVLVITLLVVSENYFKTKYNHGIVNLHSLNHRELLNNEPGVMELSVLSKSYLNNYFAQKMKNETEILKLAQHNTNLAIKYTKEWHKTYWRSSIKEWSGANLSICDIIPPQIEKIEMNNFYWQSIVDTEDLNLYSYNAYYDNRQNTNKIRIIGISDHFNKLTNTSLWCLLFFKGRKRSVLVEVKEVNQLAYDFKNFYKRKGYYLPVLLTFDIPNDIKDMVPKAVAIKTSSNCSQRLNNLFRVIYNKPDNNKVQTFGVCVRALNYSYDYSIRLLEWLELIKMLGAHKIFLYSFTVHSNMETVINYYERKNFIEWKHTSHAGKQLNNKFLDEIYIKRMSDLLLPQETLELNDCLYKNLYRYEYLVILDIDEVIAPVNAINWHDMLTQIHNNSIIKKDKKQFGSYLFSQTKFYNELETEEFNLNKYLFTMRHLYRGNFTANAPKSFHLTKNIKIVWNHSALKCINTGKKEECPLHWVKKDIGYLLHYRTGTDKPQNCSSEDLRSCATFDTILLKYNKKLETNIKIALNEIFV